MTWKIEECDWWPLPPEPAGIDEPIAQRAYEDAVDELGDAGTDLPPWEGLEEWKREAWRAEIRA